MRDFEVNMLKRVCSDETEPQLQPANGEEISGLTWDGVMAKMRISTKTKSPSQIHLTPAKILEKHEKEKNRQYNGRITFSVLSCLCIFTLFSFIVHIRLKSMIRFMISIECFEFVS